MRGLLIRLSLLGLLGVLIPACSGQTRLIVTGTPGIFVMSASGGNGSNGDGGNGAYIQLYHNQTAGDLRVLKTGRVNAAVTIPAVQPFLGTNPLIVNANTVVTPGPLGDMNATIVGADLVNPATGLWVKPGVTLTIRPSFDDDNADMDSDATTGTLETGIVNFTAGVFIEGTLLAGRMDAGVQGDGLSDHGARLLISADSMAVTAAGRVDSRGTSNVAGATGGNGGDLSFFVLNGMFVNAGTVTCAGGADDNGGNAGLFAASSTDGGAFNGGTIDATGGAGSAGSGGFGGSIDLNGFGLAGVHNNGSLLTRGGNGTLGGGQGGSIFLSTDSIGACTSSGVMDASGGHATNLGNGGNSGSTSIDVNSGSVRLAGTIRSRGGNGGPNGGDGGDGNFLDVYADGTEDFVYQNYVPEGIFIGADVDTGGGNGENGGDAGYVYVECYAGGYARPVGITLVGYVSLRIDGGSGSVNGGDAGVGDDSYFYIDEVLDNDDGLMYAGQIYNEVPFFGRGGSGGTGDGGSGAYHYYQLNSSNVDSGPTRGIVNRASMDLSGGNGGDDGGSASGFDIYYYPSTLFGSEVGIESEGTIDTKGGNGTSGSGGGGGGMTIQQDDSNQDSSVLPSGVNLSGSLILRGGRGGADGGDSGSLDIDTDFWVSITGTVDVRGGDGTTGDGGSAGDFDITIDNIPSSFFIDQVGIDFTGSMLGQGGRGGVNGSSGADCHWDSQGHLAFSGTWNSSGGAGGTGDGGGASHWRINSETYLHVSGSVLIAGGSTTGGTGGDGADFEVLTARAVTLAAFFSSRGGNSTNGTGGDGAGILLWFTEGPVFAGSSMDVRGGTGAPAGTDGTIELNGTVLANPTASF